MLIRNYLQVIPKAQIATCLLLPSFVTQRFFKMKEMHLTFEIICRAFSIIFYNVFLKFLIRFGEKEITERLNCLPLILHLIELNTVYSYFQTFVDEQT